MTQGRRAFILPIRPDGTQLVSGSGDGTLRAWDSVALRERWHAREERRRDMAALRPIVEEMFAEQGGDADRVLALVREKYPAGDASTSRLRRAALDVVLQASLARLAAE